MTKNELATAYAYKAKVVRWVDGDTVILDVDLGFHMHTTTWFRLLNVDTPERGQDQFVESVQMVNQLAPEESEVVVESHKTGKYGRWLAVVYPMSECDKEEPKSINDVLIEKGWVYGK